MQIDVIHKAFEDKPRLVATVFIPEELSGNIDQALEYAYRWTQNINGSWSNKSLVPRNSDWNNNIMVRATLDRDDDGNAIGLRSTSVDDDFQVTTTKTYRVASTGFKEMEE